MPVYRDVLAWDVFELGVMNRPLLPVLVRQVRYLMVSALIEAMWIHCPLAKPDAVNHLGIRRDCAIVLCDFGRLLVVLFKGRHLSCFTVTGGSAFEICEIGE
jgi:hypothetical protein